MDMTNGVVAGQENATASGQFATAPQPNGRFYTQDEINGLIRNVKEQNIQSLARIQTEQPQYFEQKVSPYVTGDSDAVKIAKNAEIRQTIAEQVDAKLQSERQRWQQEQADNYRYQTVNKFKEREQLGAKKYEDFATVVNDESVSAYPLLTQAAVNGLDNAEDVLYELIKDPERAWQIESAVRAGSPAGMNILKKVSNEVKTKLVKQEEDIQPQAAAFVRKLTSSAIIPPKTSGPSVSDMRKTYKF